MTDGEQRSVRSSARGRPEATSHAAIEQAAFTLFAERGFARTTLDAIAEAVGVSRRTLFRYYQSKNDIPWGQFDRTLDHFRELLADQPDDLPVHAAIHRAVVEFNRFPADAHPPHRERMRLILTTPELQAHSVLRYAEWRQVIAEDVARRTGSLATDLVPQVAGHVSLAISLSAYEHWLARPRARDADLLTIIDDAMGGLRGYLRA
ncbi:mycofactocin system transcriptional regulator [Nocardioides aromaticivorans]|uniref:mycofactocin system transcriptional regulator n=1 Tax=Nocardioides aromaticivorans TaxID=200618 RepID=UPI001A909195|nr:mycofactocin system transcriptional regulator [Nocardioides aromaticivorans]